MNPKAFQALTIALALSLPGASRASLTVYLGLPGVTGEASAPARPNVIAVDSLSLGASAFAATKRIDSTSVGLLSAALTATPYTSASLYFYDAVLTDAQPDGQLVLGTSFVTGITPVTLGSDPGERVAFAFNSPSLSLFLELPGLTGESSAPGHPGVIAVESVLLSGNGFSVLKTVDSTSSALLSAVLTGTPYASASLLVYENVLNETRPDLEFVYQRALVSSIVSAPSPDVAKENVSFATAGVTVPEPGPGALATLAAGLLAGALAWRAKYRKTPRAGSR